jgi:hypothetical protein
MNKQLIDNCFYCEEQKWGTYNSYTPEGKCIVTSLTEEYCIAATRFYLKMKQENCPNEIETTYTGIVENKL